MIAYIDGGTTYTRIYVLDKKELIWETVKKIGARDTVIRGSNDILIETLKTVFSDLDLKNQIKLSDIRCIIMSGMLSSEIGLVELPHLEAPTSLDDLAENIYITDNLNIFGYKVPLIFIRGIKNKATKNISSLKTHDFMRGEETQVIGLLSKLKLKGPLNVVVLSSHTKLIHINKNNCIEGGITTMSGQLYDAINKETLISKSIKKGEFEEEDYFSEKIIDLVESIVDEAGFLRAILMPRLMQVFIKTKSYERRFFLEAIFAIEDMKTLDKADKIMGFDLDTNFYILGQPGRCRLYKYLIEKRNTMKNRIDIISDKNEIKIFSIEGALAITDKIREKFGY